MSLSPKTDTTLFVLALLAIEAGAAMLYPQLTASPVASWNAASWSTTDHRSSAEQASPVHKLPGRVAVGTGLQLLDTNPLNGLPSSGTGAQQGGMTWSPSSWSAVGAGGGAPAGQQSTYSSRSRTQTGSGGRRWSGAGASAEQGTPGGWVGALASSSDELQRLEQQAGAIGQQIRSMRATPKIVDQGRRPMPADEYSTGPMPSMDDDAPLPADPLPPNPVPVDGGLVVLALAGGQAGPTGCDAYGPIVPEADNSAGLAVHRRSTAR